MGRRFIAVALLMFGASAQDTEPLSASLGVLMACVGIAGMLWLSASISEKGGRRGH